MGPPYQGANHSIACDETGTPLDFVSKSMSIMDHTEVDLHHGYIWRYYHRVSLLTGTAVSFIFKPARIINPALVEMGNWVVLNAFSVAALRIEIYKGPAMTSDGTEVIGQNAILCNDVAPIAKVYRDPTFTSEGTKVDEIPGGASKESAIIPNLEEWQCSNTIMHIKIINLDNSTQEITTRFRIAEHE